VLDRVEEVARSVLDRMEEVERSVLDRVGCCPNW
jgi:hypothetical protein